MKAAFLTAVETLELRDIPIPEIKDNQCLIKVGACTICATDAGHFTGKFEHPFPFPLGHEVAGTIHQVGRDVTAFQPGDRVFSRMAWGGFAEYVPSDADLIAHLPDHVPFDQGAIGQLLPLAVRAAELAVEPGSYVFVSGLGGAGLLCVQTAKAYDAKKIIAADLYPMKRNIARQLGAHLTLDPSADDIPHRIRDETAGGVHVAIEAVGNDASFRACEAALRTNGHLCVFGLHPRPVPIDLNEWDTRSLHLHMVNEPPDEKSAMLAKAARLLTTRKIDLAPLLTKIMPLSEITAAIKTYLANPDKHIKIAIQP